MAMRCRWPPERRTPRSPKPAGDDALRFAARGARLTVADEGVRATMPDSRGLRGGGLFRRAQKGDEVGEAGVSPIS